MNEIMYWYGIAVVCVILFFMNAAYTDLLEGCI